jgi:hypothetical protein
MCIFGYLLVRLADKKVTKNALVFEWEFYAKPEGPQ